jgi:hypothetical protein
MWNLESGRRLDSFSCELVNGLHQVSDTIDKNWLISFEMAGEQEGRRVLGQLAHRDPRSKCLDGEHWRRPEAIGEVLQIASNITAREVDKVEVLEQEPQSTRRTSLSRGHCQHPAEALADVAQNGRGNTAEWANQDRVAEQAVAAGRLALEYRTI